ncbi:MAG TPA: hypothetical protein VNN79_22470 [Actinomycetota bacterium]|nr:hypothetical protein [Actinomycetota bacterium]
MATGSTRITDWQGSVYAAILEENIQHELRPYNTFRPLTRKGAPGPSQIYSFNTVADPGTTDVTGITEGSTDLVTSNVHRYTLNSVASATAAQVGVMAIATDFLKATSILDIPGELTGLLVRTMREKYETDAVAQGATTSAFTPSVGDSATTMTLSRHFAALSKLEQNDNVAQMAAVYHAKQVGDFRQDVLGLGSTVLVGNENLQGILSNSLQGYVGSPGGVPIFQTTLVPTASSAYVGQMLAVNSAIGEYSPDSGWYERVEFQRDASKVSDEFVCSSAYGFATIDVNRGCLVKSST